MSLVLDEIDLMGQNVAGNTGFIDFLDCSSTLTLTFLPRDCFRDFVVSTLALFHGSICEIRVAEQYLDGVFFATSDAFAQIVEMGVELLGYTEFEFVTLIAAPKGFGAFPIALDSLSNRLEGVCRTGRECEMNVRVLVVLSSLSNAQIGVNCIDLTLYNVDQYIAHFEA